MLPFFSEVAAIRISFPRSWREPWLMEAAGIDSGVGVGVAEGAGPRHICLTEALAILILWAQVSLTGSRAQLASGKASLVRKTSFFPTLIWSQRTRVGWHVRGFIPPRAAGNILFLFTDAGVKSPCRTGRGGPSIPLPSPPEV